MMERKIIYGINGITALLIGVFLFTGMEKVWHHDIFIIKLDRQPLAEWIRYVLEWGLPVAELFVIALLVIGRTRLWGLWIAAAMLLIFSGYSGYASMEPTGVVPCACGKLFNALTWGQHVWVNLGLTTLAVVGIVLHHRYTIKSEPKDGQSPEFAENIAQSSG